MCAVGLMSVMPWSPTDCRPPQEERAHPQFRITLLDLTVVFSDAVHTIGDSQVIFSSDAKKTPHRAGFLSGVLFGLTSR